MRVTAVRGANAVGEHFIVSSLLIAHSARLGTRSGRAQIGGGFGEKTAMQLEQFINGLDHKRTAEFS